MKLIKVFALLFCISNLYAYDMPAYLYNSKGEMNKLGLQTIIEDLGTKLDNTVNTNGNQTIYGTKTFVSTITFTIATTSTDSARLGGQLPAYYATQSNFTNVTSTQGATIDTLYTYFSTYTAPSILPSTNTFTGQNVFSNALTASTTLWANEIVVSSTETGHWLLQDVNGNYTIISATGIWVQGLAPVMQNDAWITAQLAEKLHVSSGTTITTLLAGKLSISSGTVFESAIASKLPLSSGTVIESAIAGKLPLSTGTIVDALKLSYDNWRSTMTPLIDRTEVFLSTHMDTNVLYDTYISTNETNTNTKLDIFTNWQSSGSPKYDICWNWFSTDSWKVDNMYTWYSTYTATDLSNYIQLTDSPTVTGEQWTWQSSSPTITLKNNFGNSKTTNIKRLNATNYFSIDNDIIQPGWASGLYFNLDNANVNVPDNARFDLPGAFSVEMWAKPLSTTGSGVCIRKYTSATGDGFLLQQYNGNWLFTTYVNSTGKTCTSNIDASGDWQHIVGVRDAVGLMTLFVDGIVQTQTQTNAGLIDNAGSLYFGNNEVLNDEFEGYLDELVVYNYAITTTSITSHYNNGVGRLGGIETGLIWGVHLDEQSGSVANDFSGNYDTGTITGATYSDGIVPSSSTPFNVEILTSEDGVNASEAGITKLTSYNKTNNLYGGIILDGQTIKMCNSGNPDDAINITNNSVLIDTLTVNNLNLESNLYIPNSLGIGHLPDLTFYKATIKAAYALRIENTNSQAKFELNAGINYGDSYLYLENKTDLLISDGTKYVFKVFGQEGNAYTLGSFAIGSTTAPVNVALQVSSGSIRLDGTNSKITFTHANAVIRSTTSAIQDNTGIYVSTNAVISGNLTVTSNVVVGNLIQFSTNNVTGAGTPLLGTNCPAAVLSAPTQWIGVKLADNTTGYFPVWK